MLLYVKNVGGKEMKIESVVCIRNESMFAVLVLVSSAGVERMSFVLCYSISFSSRATINSRIQTLLDLVELNTAP